MWIKTKPHSWHRIFHPLSQHHRCVFIAAGKGRRKRNYYPLHNVPECIYCSTQGCSQDSYALLWDVCRHTCLCAWRIFTGGRTTHTDSNVKFDGQNVIGVVSSPHKGFLLDSLLCKHSMEMLKNKSRDICMFKHSISCWMWSSGTNVGQWGHQTHSTGPFTVPLKHSEVQFYFYSNVILTHLVAICIIQGCFV